MPQPTTLPRAPDLTYKTQNQPMAPVDNRSFKV
jgi:hypothetical protein